MFIYVLFVWGQANTLITTTTKICGGESHSIHLISRFDVLNFVFVSVKLQGRCIVEEE